MEFNILIQILTGGILLGVIWGMVALGLNLIFGVMRVINIAHGEFLMFGAFLTYQLYQYGIPPMVSMILIIPVLFIAGVLVQYTVINRVLRADNPELMSLLSTFALLLILQNVGRAIWSTESKAIQTSFLSKSTSLFGVNLSYGKITTIVVSIAAMSLLYLITTKTEFGLAMQATVQNRKMAKISGINTNKIYYITFGMSTALAGVAGSLVSMVYPITTGMGFSYVIMGFLVIIFGGMGSVVGAMFGAIILGIIGSIGGYFFGSGTRDIILLVILIIVLFIRPKGVFGEARV